MRRLCLFFLLGAVAFCGCGPREDAQLYIYCNETFWYVMQEEALSFNQISGSQIILIPIRANRTADKTEGITEIGTARRAPAPWRSMPREQTDFTVDLRTQVNPDIEQQITRISQEHFGDMFLTDSQKQAQHVRDTALSANEYLICYLTLTMLVPKGNPLAFHSVRDVLDMNRTLGIMDPSFDGLGESSWQMLGNVVPGGESAIPMDLIRIFERQYDLLEALELGNIDAALVWNATSQINFLLVKYSDEYNAAHEAEMRAAERRKDTEELRALLQAMFNHLVETRSFAEEVPLSDHPDERCVVAVRLIALSSALNFGYCERFADFMRSNQGKGILRRFGFVPE